MEVAVLHEVGAEMECTVCTLLDIDGANVAVPLALAGGSQISAARPAD